MIGKVYMFIVDYKLIELNRGVITRYQNEQCWRR